jgi:hypothetical protein
MLTILMHQMRFSTTQVSSVMLTQVEKVGNLGEKIMVLGGQMEPQWGKTTFTCVYILKKIF